MELQTVDHSVWDRSPVAFTKTGVVSQFATFTTTDAFSRHSFKTVTFVMRLRAYIYTQEINENNLRVIIAARGNVVS